MIYHMTIASVLLMVRYPRCIHTGKLLFGDSGELIIEDLLQQGQSLMSQVSPHIHNIVAPIIKCLLYSDAPMLILGDVHT